MEITFDPKKLSRMKIGRIRPNDWNPKLDDTEDQEKVRMSVKENGQRLPIVVRKCKGENEQGVITPYQIIDGEQRYKACVALGFKEVLVYDEGALDDDAAKALTVWYQQQVPFDKLLEAQLIAAISHLPLPYTDDELADMRNLVEFDWTQVKPDENEEVEFRTFTVHLLKDAYAIVMEALDSVKDTQGVTTERALELICADYLSGPSLKA